MPPAVAWALWFLAGLGTGAVFFGGLWLTVRALPSARHPTVLAIVSFWGRTALTVAVFAFVFSRGWRSIVASLLGFVVARLMMARVVPHHRSAVRAGE